MNLTSLLRQARFVVIVLLVVCVAVIAFSVWRVPVVKSNPDGLQQFQTRLRDGVGNEIILAAPGDSSQRVNDSVNSLASFIYYRSGVSFSDATKNRLSVMETNVLSGAQRHLTPVELRDILTDIALERLATLTPQQIEYAAETLRGFNHPQLPEVFRDGRDYVALRASRVDKLTPAELVDYLTKVKGADGTSKRIYRAFLMKLLEEQISSRSSSLKEAVPEKFGSINNNLTPVRAVLLTYSVAGDDYMADSSANLRSTMQKIQTEINTSGLPYPSPDGHKAYGPNGYMYSSPLDLLLDEQTMNLLLDKIQERSATT
jgi:hypothetical protein